MTLSTQPTLQLLREWPPGFGGVERVAHELATEWGGDVYSFDVQRRSSWDVDPCPVGYQRLVLPCIRPFGRLVLPKPSRGTWHLLRSNQPLHGHLPSPAVLLLLLLARLLRPRRRVTVHWHCFLAGSLDANGMLYSLYQWLALRGLPWMSEVVTTSPILAAELVRCGVPAAKVKQLACCLSDEQEAAALSSPIRAQPGSQALRIIFIGRLESYKRLDWLLEALQGVGEPWHLDVVGDGPERERFERLSRSVTRAGQQVVFHGRLPEADKFAVLASAHVLVLPSDRCNEAFGIVQLEAMAAGVPSLAFQCARSGMGWVCEMPGLDWAQTRDALPQVLQRLCRDPSLRERLGQQARDRYRALFSRQVWRQHLAALAR